MFRRNFTVNIFSPLDDDMSGCDCDILGIVGLVSAGVGVAHAAVGSGALAGVSKHNLMFEYT